MRAHSLVSATLPFLVFAVGCADSADTPPVEADVSDVRVARCPTDVNLRFGAPRIFDETPRFHHGGLELTEGEVERVAEVMTHARSLPGIETKLHLHTTASGKCYYRGDQPGHQATFRTTNGKDVFQIYLPGGVQLFAFPTSYETSGLTFEPHAEATVFASVAQSSSFGEGPSLSIEIGDVALEPNVTDQ